MLRPEGLPRQPRDREAERERERGIEYPPSQQITLATLQKKTKERASLLARLPSSSEPKQCARTHEQQRVAEQTREGFEKAGDHRTWTHMSGKGKLMSTRVQRRGTCVACDESSAARQARDVIAPRATAPSCHRLFSAIPSSCRFQNQVSRFDCEEVARPCPYQT